MVCDWAVHSCAGFGLCDMSRHVTLPNSNCCHGDALKTGLPCRDIMVQEVVIVSGCAGVLLCSASLGERRKVVQFAVARRALCPRCDQSPLSVKEQVHQIIFVQEYVSTERCA